jgi:hypothetical protein
LKLLTSIALLTTALVCGSAHARTLALEWQEVEGATKYEVRISDENGTETLHPATKTAFEKKLPPGRYEYSIRSWDRLERPSKWSEPVGVEIEPLPPELRFPIEEEIHLGPSKRGIELTWDSTEGGDAYEIEIEREEEKLLSKKVAAIHTAFEPTEPGPYQWRVRSVHEKLKADSKSQPLPGPWSEWKLFTVLFPNLPPPVLDPPRSHSNTTEHSEISLSWTAVRGASGYEVAWGMPSRHGARLPNRKVIQSTDTKILIPYGTRAEFQVRALASPQFPERFVSEPATATVDLFTLADWPLRSKFQLSYATGSYTFENLSVAGNIAGNASGGFSQLFVQSDTVLSRRWSIHTNWIFHMPFISGGTYVVPRASASVRFRHVFPDSKWALTYGTGGIASANLDFVTNRNNGSASSPAVKMISTFGALLESSLEWRFLKKWKVDTDLALGIPLILKDAPAGSSLVPSLTHMRLGTTVGYHFSPTWALNLGVAWERNAVFYKTSGATGSESIQESVLALRLGLAFIFP